MWGTGMRAIFLRIAALFVVGFGFAEPSSAQQKQAAPIVTMEYFWKACRSKDTQSDGHFWCWAYLSGSIDTVLQ
jgi:hypothetical protein